MTYDVARVRSAYPALSSGTAYLDGAAGTQSPSSVIEAVADAYRHGTSNAGGFFASSQRADEVTTHAREAVADLVNADPEGVVLGPNMTTLTYRFAQALSTTWRPGDNVVVSQLDHDANVRPWVAWAARAGADVRWATVDCATGELPSAQYHGLVDKRTRLVAVSAASNVLGTRPDVTAIGSIAHEAGALTYVDGVHSTAHGVVDAAAMGADFYATSAYKWDGPHVGCVVAAPALLRTLQPDKLDSSADTVPDRFEWGTPSFHNFAGVRAAVDHLAALDGDVSGSRRERLVASLTAAEQHEQELLGVLLAGLEADDRVTVFGKPQQRTATVYFRLDTRTPDDVARALAEHDVAVWSGHNYAWELTAALGIRDDGSAVRASISHYTDVHDVQRLLDAVRAL